MSKEEVKKRSYNMSQIKSKNSKIEVDLRHGLYHKGYRYRLYSKELVGQPDIYLPKYKAAIFVNGCFWHGHGCWLFHWPKTNSSFWEGKIRSNMRRDTFVVDTLMQEGLRVGIVWECALRGAGRLGLDRVVSMLDVWMNSSVPIIHICGKRYTEEKYTPNDCDT